MGRSRRRGAPRLNPSVGPHTWCPAQAPCESYAIGVVCSTRFVETHVFTAALRGRLSDREYRRLQLALILRPEQGALLRAAGGLRKLLWGAEGRGKRAGLRVIYFWAPAEEVFYTLFVYPKNAQEDLTPAQVKVLRRLVAEDFA